MGLILNFVYSNWKESGKSN